MSIIITLINLIIQFYSIGFFFFFFFLKCLEFMVLKSRGED